MKNYNTFIKRLKTRLFNTNGTIEMVTQKCISTNVHFVKLLVSLMPAINLINLTNDSTKLSKHLNDILRQTAKDKGTEGPGFFLICTVKINLSLQAAKRL